MRLACCLPMPLDEGSLLHLLKAKNPKVIDSIFTTSFRLRHEGVSEQTKAGWRETLELSSEEVNDLCTGVAQLIHKCIYENVQDKAAVGAMFSDDFHGALKGLIAKIIVARVGGWREACLSNQVSPPKLVDFDWRVDQKRSSNFLSRMTVPSVIVEMKVQKQPTQKGVMPGVEDIQFELSKEALGTMLDGLGKIRDQLGSLN